jgi:hypothetical protein
MGKCITLRPGIDCAFWSRGKCSIDHCDKIVDDCRTLGDCGNIAPDGYCSKWPKPSVQWKTLGGCSLYTKKVLKEVEKHKLNPIKASKKLKGKK